MRSKKRIDHKSNYCRGLTRTWPTPSLAYASETLTLQGFDTLPKFIFIAQLIELQNMLHAIMSFPEAGSWNPVHAGCVALHAEVRLVDKLHMHVTNDVNVNAPHVCVSLWLNRAAVRNESFTRPVSQPLLAPPEGHLVTGCRAIQPADAAAAPHTPPAESLVLAHQCAHDSPSLLSSLSACLLQAVITLCWVGIISYSLFTWRYRPQPWFGECRSGFKVSLENSAEIFS